MDSVKLFLRATTPDPVTISGAGTLEEAIHELYSIVTEVNNVHLAYVVLSLFVVVFGLYSGFIKDYLYVGEAIIATGVGVAFSGYAGDIFAPRTWSEGHHFDELTLEITRVVIALAVFAVGVELPKAYLLRHWKSLAVMLGPVMVIGWLISGALMYGIIPGLGWLPALVVAAGVTPTDPILAASVVGKGAFAQDHVPSHIRHLLQAESGCNDGAAFPFLYLALFLLMRGEHTVGKAVGWWLVLVVLYQIILGIFIGALIGVLARKLMKFSKRRELIDRESMVAMYIALALLVTGLTTLAGSDDLLAAFACGSAFAWDDWFTESIEESNFSSTIDLLANCAMFIYIGATMPFSAWNDAQLTLTPWRLVLLAIAILVLRRLPAIFAIQYFVPDIKTRREAIFCGHFGPMGVGAIFISTLAATKLPTPNIPPQNNLDILALTIQPITYFIVLSSILVHGLTISFFSLGRRVHTRVASISRTFTAASGDGNEPSWMSRVKRVRSGDEIVVNRDDGEKGDEKGHEKGEDGGGEGEKRLGAKGTDDGDLAMFGAPPENESGTTSSSSSAEIEKRESGEKEGEHEAGHRGVSYDEQGHEHDHRSDKEREDDDNPPDNLLAPSPDAEGHGGNEHERVNAARHRHSSKLARMSEAAKEEDSSPPARPKSAAKDGGSQRSKSPVADDEADVKKERQFCSPDDVETYMDGDKMVVVRNGENAEVLDVAPSKRAQQAAQESPSKDVLQVPSEAVNREKKEIEEKGGAQEDRESSAVKRVANRMLRAGSMAGVSGGLQAGLQQLNLQQLMKTKDENLTPEQREKKQRQKEIRDAACKRERHFKDYPTEDLEQRSQAPGKGKRRDLSPAKADANQEGAREWVEGDQVVIEYPDDHIEVRKLSKEEKEARAAEHLAALRALGHPIEALEAEFSKLRKTTSKEMDYFRHPGGSRPPSAAGKHSKPPSHQSATPQASPSLPSTSANRVTSQPRSTSPSRLPQTTETPTHTSPAEDAPAPRPRMTGFALERTERIEPSSDDEDDETGDRSSPLRAPSASRSPSRPGAGPRKESKVAAQMKQLFKRDVGNTDSGSRITFADQNRGRDASAPGSRTGSRANSPSRSIRFIEGGRPARDANATGTGRALPVVGGNLSIRRTGTGGSNR